MSRRQIGQPIRVLIVEDSRPQLQLLINLLQTSNAFVVVGTASTGKEAVEATIRLRPDIVAMDIHLPVFDGYEATRQIMQQCPTPIVMISNTISDTARRALEAQTVGALAVVRKPGSVSHRDHAQDREVMLKTLRLMADVPVVTRHAPRAASVFAPGSGEGTRQRISLLGVASSTGGPAAVQMLLNGLKAAFPLPVLLAQHIARGFVEALVDWLNNTTPFTVRIAQADEQMQPGHVYIPPDDYHILTREQGIIALQPLAAEDRYCPNADYLFQSIARVYGKRAMGIILTGMGSDGAEGLRTLHQTGAVTLAQDEASCVVYGMPQAAVALGAVTRVEPLDNLARAVRQYLGLAATD